VVKSKKRKPRRNVTVGIAHVKATFNNTTVTITDTKGDTLCWASGGTSGFKGSRKSTPFAGQCAAQQAAEKAAKFGVKELEVRVKGPGSHSSQWLSAAEEAARVKCVCPAAVVPGTPSRWVFFEFEFEAAEVSLSMEATDAYSMAWVGAAEYCRL
jgi:small subunit ribosomal protein S11